MKIEIKNSHETIHTQIIYPINVLTSKIETKGITYQEPPKNIPVITFYITIGNETYCLSILPELLNPNIGFLLFVILGIVQECQTDAVTEHPNPCDEVVLSSIISYTVWNKNKSQGAFINSLIDFHESTSALVEN